MRAAGPPQGRLHEPGETKARSARPRALAAADAWLLHSFHPRKEVANCAAAQAASVGVHR